MCEPHARAAGPVLPLSPPGRALIFMVFLYRATLGRFLGGHCRFEPTCSQYMIDAVRRYGAWCGLWRGIGRIGRCHPWGGSGYDPA